MQIKKDMVKKITEVYNVVNSFAKHYRNPHNSFLYLASKGEYLSGDFEEKDGKYYCRKGNVTYIVTLNTK